MALSWLAPKLARVSGDPWGEYGHWCPGCGELHVIAVDKRNPSNAIWSFDGNLVSPTFNPSMNIRIGPHPCNSGMEICHYFLRGGRIEFLSDCTHALAGQTVDLPDIPAKWSPFSPAYHPPVVQS